MNNLTFQEARESDVDAILDIYNFYVVTTTASFSLGPVSREEFCERAYIAHEKYRTYLINYGNELAGFCFLTQFRKKKAYDWTAEIGLYLKPEFIAKGIGREAIAFLEKIAIGKQIRVLVASISCENTASIKLCQRMGYEQCAHYREAGEKFGRILDVVDFQKIL